MQGPIPNAVFITLREVWTLPFFKITQALGVGCTLSLFIMKQALGVGHEKDSVRMCHENTPIVCGYDS